MSKIGQQLAETAPDRADAAERELSFTKFELWKAIVSLRSIRLALQAGTKEPAGLIQPLAQVVEDLEMLFGPEPEQDQCCECDRAAVGYAEGQPYCGAHYRSRPTVPDYYKPGHSGDFPF